MSEAEWKQKCEDLQRQLDESKELVRALVNGELDSLVQALDSTPVLLRAAQETLRANEQLLRAIFDGAMDGMLIADDRGIYIDANPAACELFGVPKTQLVGKSIGDFAAPGYTPASFAEFVAEGRLTGEFLLHRPDGTRRELDYAAVANVLPGLHLSVLRDVTERKAADRARDAAEQRLRTVISNAPVILFAIDRDGVYSLHEGKGVEAVGLRPGQIVGQSVFARQGDTRNASESIRRALGGEQVTGEFVTAGRTFDCVLVPVLDAQGVVSGITGVAMDVSERKVAEAAKRASEARFRAMIEHSQDGIALLGADLKAIYQSPAVDRILGYTLAEASRMSWSDFVDEEERPRLQRAIETLMEQPSASVAIDFRIRARDGRRLWLELTATNLLHDPAVGAIITNFRDVTTRKNMERELRASELRYRRIVDNTSEGVWMYDADGITTFMNPRMASMLGWTVEEALGQPIFAFMDAEARVEARRRLERRKLGRAERGELRLRRRDGTDLWVSLHADPLFDEAGRFESSLVLLADITARRQAEQTRNQLASIVASSDDAILSRAIDGTIRTWNRGAERLTQYSAEEAIGKSITMLYPPEHSALLDSARADVDEGATLEQFEMTFVRKDGSRIEVSLTSSILKEEDGKIIGASIIARDISERRKSEAALRRSEEQLRQAQKMEAVGCLAGGIAHDFNNLLSVILSYTSIILEDLPPADPLRADLDEVNKAGLRATELTRHLLAFSRKQILQPMVVDLNQVVSGVEKMLRHMLGEDVELALLTSPTAGKIHADPGQIEQIIMNLVVNARDAMPAGGNLTIETANRDLDESYAREHPGVTAGPHVMLAVTDTGIGMDRATAARIFEPFFTTKDPSRGTGLGLSTVYGIVQQSGGHVWVYSEPGNGTSFKVYFPRTDRAVEPQSMAPSTATSLRGSETILLVEDDSQVRTIMRSILRKSGYHVLEAQNGGEAFLLCEQFTAKIHMLLTDVVMPRLSGRQLAERLTLLRPGMKVLFVSGYTEDTIIRHGVLDAGIDFLAKPIMPDELLKKVRQVLDSQSRRPPGTASPSS